MKFYKRETIALVAIVAAVCAHLLRAQVETVEGPRAAAVWVSHGRVEGHLALGYSPAGAFSPDSATLAVVSEDKVVLMSLRDASPRSVLRPRLQEITDLEIQSANFLEPERLFLLGTGLFHAKEGGRTGPTPLLAFEWDVAQNALTGKVNAVGAKGGFAPARFFPELGYVGLYKESTFDLWSPSTGRVARITIPDLTRQPNLYAFSPDGHWLLVAQIEGSSSPDPTVVLLKEHRFVESLHGHRGTVLSIAFSHDARRVVTTCEDGKVRLWSVPDWKLLHELTGHQGPVHWAAFSPDSSLVASGGEDKTVRVWSVEDGRLVQTLAESQSPILTLAFSPNGEYLAATSDRTVAVWQRTGGAR